jgi:hypothetical protein
VQQTQPGIDRSGDRGQVHIELARRYRLKQRALRADRRSLEWLAPEGRRERQSPRRWAAAGRPGHRQRIAGGPDGRRPVSRLADVPPISSEGLRDDYRGGSQIAGRPPKPRRSQRDGSVFSPPGEAPKTAALNRPSASSQKIVPQMFPKTTAWAFAEDQEEAARWLPVRPMRPRRLGIRTIWTIWTLRDASTPRVQGWGSCERLARDHSSWARDRRRVLCDEVLAAEVRALPEDLARRAVRRWPALSFRRASDGLLHAPGPIGSDGGSGSGRRQLEAAMVARPSA